MILSTHSDYVLDHVEPENVYRVSFDKLEGTVVRHIPKSMTSRELGALRRYLEREGNLGDGFKSSLGIELAAPDPDHLIEAACPQTRHLSSNCPEMRQF